MGKRINQALFLITLALFAISLGHLDRLFLKSNGSFCIDFIHSKIEPKEQWKVGLPFPQEALNQPFHYLAKGSQTFVFASQDGKYVLKFYRFPSHMRRLHWRKISYALSSHRKNIKTYNEKKFALSFSSYCLAAKNLADETGVVYLHLNPTKNLRTSIKLIDKMGHAYSIPADSTCFLMQRKAESFLSSLKKTMDAGDLAQGRHMVNELIALIVQECQKGITDLDCMVRDNYGWLENRAVQLDVGRFILDPHLDKKKEVVRITQVLSDLLAEKWPELKIHFDEQISSLH